MPVMVPEDRSGWRVSFQLVMCGVGVTAGICSFFIFCFLYGNISAGLWGLGSGILAAIVLHLRLLYKNHRLHSWHTVHSLAANRNLGILTGVLSTGALVYYLYMKFSESQDVFPIKDSWMIAAVWAFMTVKWSLALVYLGHKYKCILDREYTLL